MRVAQKRKSNRGQVCSVASRPAPIGGWNARDAVVMMDETDAVLMRNWWPTSSKVEVRAGSLDHATGFIGQVESLLVYRPENAAERLFACSANGIYDATSAGSVGVAVVSATTNNKWVSVNLSTSGGNFLIAVNAADSMRQYDGAEWKAINSVSTPAITGVATSAISLLAIHKERLFMGEVNSLRAWYLPVKSIGGAASLMDLRSVFRRGGKLVAIANWSRDGGSGPDDFLAFITDQGEVAVYKGTDPASSNTWGIVGVYSIATPLGPAIGFGGDVLVLTTEGVVPLAKALVTEQTDPGIALSAKIQGAWEVAARNYAGNYGWAIVHYPRASALVVNIPVAFGRQEQYVMNTQTGAWAQFVGWPANAFAIFQGALVFAMNGAVRKAWLSESDNGSHIDASIVSAFDDFGGKSQLKHWRNARPTLSLSTKPNELYIGLCVDFKVRTATGVVTLPGAGGNVGIWSDPASLWNRVVWGGSQDVHDGWYGVSGVGYYAATALRVRTKRGRVGWSATTHLFESGGPL